MNILQANKICEIFGLEKNFNIIHDNIILKIEGKQKAIRKAEYNKERLFFINELKEYIYNKGFRNIDRFCKYNDKFFIEINQDIYYICDWYDEKMISNDENKNEKALSLLANLHKAGNGFIASENISVKNEIGKLPNLLKKRTDELLKLKKVAEKGKNKFDYLYMKECDFYIQVAISVLQDLNSKEYDDVVENAFLKKEICHRDYSLYNIAFCIDEPFLYNFDYSCFEINAYDIASFIRKILNETNWSISVFNKALEQYNEIKLITNQELKIIKALLKYPQKFWRIANRYYNSRRSCPDNGYYLKLQEIYEQKENYKNFVNNI